MDYSLRELECFNAVAEELSFTRAAQRLHLAQPPLSRHVRELEEKIGARLFERTRRTVALTAAGRLFHQETRMLLGQLERAAEAARRSALGETDRLRLGFVSAVLSPKLVDTLRKFRQKHPGIQLILHDNPPAEQLKALSQGAIDGGFVGMMPLERPRGIHFQSWREEPLMGFVPADHPLAARGSVELAELAGEAFVAVSGEAAPAFAAHVRELCRDAGFRQRVVLESPRAQAVVVMVAAGCGVALLPESLVRVMGSAVVAVKLKGARPIAHVFARPAGEPSPAMTQFLRFLD